MDNESSPIDPDMRGAAPVMFVPRQQYQNLMAQFQQSNTFLCALLHMWCAEKKTGGVGFKVDALREHADFTKRIEPFEEQINGVLVYGFRIIPPEKKIIPISGANNK